MNIKKIFRRKISHKIGIFVIVLALFEIFLVLNPMWSLSLIPSPNVLMLFETLLVPVTTFFLFLYVFQFFKSPWLDKWRFTRGYLIGLFVSIVIIFMSSFTSDLFVHRIFPIKLLLTLIINIVNVSGDYRGFVGGITLYIIGKLFILLVLLPVTFGFISSLIFKRSKGTLPE